MNNENLQIEKNQNDTTKNMENLSEIKEWKDIGYPECEIWKNIDGYEGIYQVSSWGKIKSLFRKLNVNGRGRQIVNETILKPKVTKQGYESVRLSKNRIAQTVLVHRIVAKTFIFNPENKPVVHHKNFKRNDNFYKNLEWCTPYENNHYGFVAGRYDLLKGENNSLARLTGEKALKIRTEYLFAGMTAYELARQFNVSPATIYNVINNKTWKDNEYNLIKNSKFFQEIKRLNYNRGNKNHNSPLIEKDVLKIREMYKNREHSSVELAKIFNVSKFTIISILNRKTWNHI